MKTVCLVLGLGVAGLLVGCMDDMPGGMGGMGGMDMSSSSSSSSGTGGTGGSGGGSSGPPLAPMITSVEPLQGGLHVMWTNVTPDCDKIELDRNKDAGTYATAYTLVGVATSQHDTAVAPPATYCYKARCIKGVDKSPDSNEKCGMP